MKFPRFSKKLPFVAGTVAVSFLGLSGQLIAAALEEVIVTAQKRSESVNDVPITISAFSGDKLKELGVIDTRDLGKIVPGFKYSDTGLNKPVFTLRGIGYNDFAQTASGTVGIYVGEFNLPYPVMSKGPTVDIQRVEVLKGPQGTLYGRNTTAGVVNFIPNQPTEEFEAGVLASYSRFETWDTEAYVSGAVTDTLGMRLAARKIKSDEGWQYSITRPDDTLGKQDKLSARYTAEWTPTETLNFLFAVDHWEDTGEPMAAQHIGFTPVNPYLDEAALDINVRNHPLIPLDTDNMRVADWPGIEHGYKWQLNDTFTMYKLRSDWDLQDDATLSYLVSYADFETDHGTLPTTGLDTLNAEGIVDVKTTAWTHELRLTGDLGDRFSYIVGGFYSTDEVSQNWVGLTDTMSALFPVNGQNPIADKVGAIAYQDSETRAVFSDVTWNMISSLSLTLGARYTKELHDFEGCTKDEADSQGIGFYALMNFISLSRGGTGGAQPGDCITLDHDTGNPGLVSQKLEEDNVSGRAVLNFTPSDGLLFYLSYSRGYKTGSFPIGQATDSQQFRPVTQERLDAIEVGGKLSLFEQSVQLNFAAFDYDYVDKQFLGFVYDQVFGPLLQLDNAPKSVVQGAEFDIRARPTESLSLFVAASYIDTEIKKYSGINQRGDFEDFAGSKFNNAPDLMGSVGVQYVWNLPWTDSFTVNVGADYSYTGDTSAVFNDDPYFKLDEFENVNAQIGLVATDESWRVTAWGRNITNEYQPVSVGSTLTDTIQRYVQMPQTYGLTVQYTYGN